MATRRYFGGFLIFLMILVFLKEMLRLIFAACFNYYNKNVIFFYLPNYITQK